MNTVANMGRLKVNLSYLPIKAHYFLYFAGTASLWPFVSIFAKQMGISERGVGYIFGFAPVMGLISKLVFGAVADHFKRKKKLFLFFILLNLMSYVCVAFLPSPKPVRPVMLECEPGFSTFRQNGRLPLQCSDNLIQSFKPKDVQQTPVNRKIEEHENQGLEYNHGFVKAIPKVRREMMDRNYVLEHCTAECDVFVDINTFLHADNFCTNIMSHDVPDVCHTLLNRTQKHNNSNNNNEAIYQSDLFEIVNDKHRLPPTLTMNVLLRITETVGTGEDLFLIVDTVSYSKRKDDYHGLSCSPKVVLDKCFLDCPNNTALNRHLELMLPEESLLDSMNFWLYGSLVVIAWCSMAVVASIGDALCFQTLGNEPHLYGNQRQWGSIGWGAFSLIAGYLIEMSSEGRLLKDYTSCFYLVAGLLTLDLIVTYKWDIRETEKPKSIRRDVCFLLSDLRIIIFILACVVVGMCTGLLWTFLFWYIDDLAGESAITETYSDPTDSKCDYNTHVKLLQGLVVAIQCFCGELPFFHVSGWFISKLGHVNCITLVLAAFGVRFITYSVLTDPWYVLPVELLQGLTFGIFYATMTSYASKVSPPGISATVQGIVGSAFEGVGVALGGLIGGLLYYNESGKIAFRIFGIGALVFSLIHAIAMFLLSRKVTYGLPVDRTEPEGQEMFRISSGSAQDVDSE